MTRIPQSDSFKALLATRPLAKTRRLQCFAIKNEGLGVRLGIMVPKRHAHRAVDRHGLKRLVREACRQIEKADLDNTDLLVRLTAPVKSLGPSDRTQWWDELQQLFARLHERW